MIEDILRYYKEQFEAKNIEMKSLLCTNPIILEVDQLRMNQILGNLLTNAIKFTPKSGSILYLLICKILINKQL